MVGETAGQAMLDTMRISELGRAIEDWRYARRECVLKPGRESRGRYCAATDELARALLGEFAAESGAQAVFERFWHWLLLTEQEPQ